MCYTKQKMDERGVLKEIIDLKICSKSLLKKSQKFKNNRLIILSVVSFKDENYYFRQNCKVGGRDGVRSTPPCEYV